MENSNIQARNENTKLDELIRQYCPNGVELKALGALVDTLKKGTLKQDALVENGMYPVMNSGRDYYGYYNEYNNDGNAVTIASRGEYAGYVAYHVDRFWAGGLCYPYRAKASICLTKYLYYVLKNMEKRVRNNIVCEGSIPALNKADIEKVIVPVPPLPVQREIVRILDSFTELEAELEAELLLRRQQYAYYKEYLLKSDFIDGEWIALEECTEKTTNIKWKDVNDTYRYVDLSSVDRETSFIGDTMVIDASNAPSRAQQIIQNGDILFGTTRPLLRRHCIVPKDYDGQIASTGYCVLRAKPDVVRPQWIYYWITGDAFYLYLKPLQVQGSYPSVTNSNVKGYQIPVPALEKQDEVIAILERFDKLCKDISSGLPAEIQARHKQYEYYRDKLLSFREV